MAETRRSGALVVGESSSLWLSDGKIYFAEVGSSDDVSALLFAVGVESSEDIGRQLEAGNAARAMVEKHPEVRPALQRLVHEHVLSALFELIVPSDASVAFHEGAVHPIGDEFAEPAADLLAEADRRLAIWTKIAARIPSTGAIFTLAPALPDDEEERTVSSDEWRYISLLDGRSSVADVINNTGESAFRVCSALYRLLLEGMIEEKK